MLISLMRGGMITQAIVKCFRESGWVRTAAEIKDRAALLGLRRPCLEDCIEMRRLAREGGGK